MCSYTTWTVILSTICWYLIELGEAIDCFECYSLEGNHRDCEDEFGPHNKTAHLVTRNCKVGYLRFKANYCVKIKGIKDNGQSVVIRTCAMNDWGTQCGDIFFDQQGSVRESLTGCLATCDFDGCNAAPPGAGGFITTPAASCLSRLFSCVKNHVLLLTCLALSSLLKYQWCQPDLRFFTAVPWNQLRPSANT